MTERDVSLPGEHWYDIPGHPDYRVSDQGRVASLKRGRFRVLKAILHKHGYLMASLGNRHFLIHRLMLEAIVGPCPPGMECRHLDDNPRNNSLLNICWGTRGDNLADRVKNGKGNRGSRCCNAKLTEANIPEIRRLFLSGMTLEVIAAKYDVSYGTISDIIQSRTWSHVPWEPGTRPTYREFRKFLKAFDETKAMSDWARDARCVVSYSVLRSRILLGWEAERAITTPLLDPVACLLESQKRRRA